jgi:hypothetical protein
MANERFEGRWGLRLLATVLVALLGAVALLYVQPLPEAQAAKKCGTVWATKPPGTYASFKVRAKRIACGKARTLVRKAWRSRISVPGESTRWPVPLFLCLLFRDRGRCPEMQTRQTGNTRTLEPRSRLGASSGIGDSSRRTEFLGEGSGSVPRGGLWTAGTLPHQVSGRSCSFNDAPPSPARLGLA